MIDKLPAYVKPTIFFSIIIGLIFGVLLMIPFINLFMILAFWLIGGFVVYILRANNFTADFTQQEAIVIGCASGMISVFAAAVTFLPLSLLVGAIFKTASLSFMFTTSLMSSFSSLFVLILLIFFLGLINIIFNIASALGVITLYNNLKATQDKPEEFELKL